MMISSIRILIIWLVISAVKIERIVGQGSNGRYDILTGDNGESSCQLKDAIYQACNTTPPSLSDLQTPTSCTCNVVFFNILSACSYSSGNSTLPLYSSWLQRCSDNSINLESSSSRADSDNIGITTPVWAEVDVPGNGAIDLQRAVVLVHEARKPWSIVQIILPIATSFAAVVIVIVFMKLFGRRLSQVEWQARILELVRPVPKVRPVDKGLLGNTWEIEPGAPAQPVRTESFVFVELPSPADTTADTVPAFRSVPSTEPWSIEAQQGSKPSVSQDVLPRERVYPFAPSAPPQIQAEIAPQPLRQVTERSNSGNSSSSSGSWHLPGSLRNMHIPVPWKRRPYPVRQVPPTRRWRVDGPDSSTDASSSRQSTSTQAGTRSGHASRLSSGGVSTIQEHGEDDSFYRHLDDGENSSLIPRQFLADRSSFLGGRSSNTHSTSVNSHIKIISPSVTTASDTPRHTLVENSRTSFIPLPPPSIPPVPNHPAPAPPLVARKTTPRERDGDVDFMLGQAPLNAAQYSMGVILEEQLSDSGRSMRGTPSPPVHLWVTSGVERGVSPNFHPIPSNEQRPSGPLQVQRSQGHIPQQSFSSTLSHGRTGSNERAPLPTPPPQNNSIHHIARKPSSENPRPLPSPSSSHLNGPGFSRVQQDTLHSRDGSGSSSASQISRKMSNDSNLSMYVDPFTPPLHGRSLSADDSASFYMTPDPPQRSVTPSRGDPVMLFPGSVRSAGYQGYAGMG